MSSGLRLKKIFIENKRDFISLVLLVFLILFLFRGYLDYGMNFDEVLRLHNIVPILNENANGEPFGQSYYDLNIMGLRIPLVVKEYISTTGPLFYLPIGLFNDYKTGVRTVRLIYFIISVIVFYLIFSRYNFFIAFFSSLLIVTSPILYPDIRFGFTDACHVMAIALAFLCFDRFFNKSKKPFYLFLAFFILAFSANYLFYFMWVNVALCLASFIFFYDYWFIVIRSFKSMALIITAVILGLFNFVLYNVMNGFPSVAPFFLNLFNKEEYNKKPIDFKPLPSFTEELSIKFICIKRLFSGFFNIYALILIIFTVLFLYLIYRVIRDKKFADYKLYFYPSGVFLFTLALILLSPKSYRAGHYVYLIPVAELAIVSLLWLFGTLFSWKKNLKIFIWTVAVILCCFNFYVANSEVNTANKTNGTGYYSPAIYDLDDYFHENNIASENVVFLQWGMYSQLYFLNRGDFQVNSLVFKLFTQTEEKRIEILENYFTSPEISRKDRLFFPLYTGITRDIRDCFFKFIAKYDGNIDKIKTFYEKDGKSEVFDLYELKDVSDFSLRVKEKVTDGEISEDFKILNFGPRDPDLENNKEGYYYIWLKVSNNSPSAVVMMNDVMLDTVYGGEDLLTATVPLDILEEDVKKYKLQLYDRERKIKSPVIYEFLR